VLVLTILPTQYEEIRVTLSENQANASSPVAQNQSVQLRLPKSLPTGQPVLIEMTLMLSPTSDPAPANRMVEGRLDLPGVAALFPDAVLNAPYQPGKTSSFRWLVTAGPDDPLTGRLWLTLIDPNPGGDEIRQPWMVRPFDLPLRRVLGLDLPNARWAGGGLAAIGLVGFIILWRGSAQKSKRTVKRHHPN